MLEGDVETLSILEGEGGSDQQGDYTNEGDNTDEGIPSGGIPISRAYKAGGRYRPEYRVRE
jgi:hypothetical protein